MLERTDSSVLVSLRELGRLEDDRVARETAARERAAADAERARVEAIEAARREEVARAEETAANLRAEREQERLDDARRSATRAAAIEHARLVAAADAELAALKARQAHELRLAEIARAGAMRKWTVVQVAAAVALLVVTGGAWHVVAAAQARGVAAQAAIAKANDERNAGIALAQERLRERGAELDRLDAKRRAEDEAARVAQSTNVPMAAPPVPTTAHHAPPSGPRHPAAPCLPRDPLCGQLP